MNAAETVRAAIQKLEGWREPECPWFYKQDPDLGYYAFPGYLASIAKNYRDDAEQIVTLHRTIDAQLKALRAAEWLLGQKNNPNAYTHAATASIIDLARSIIGEDVA